MGKLIDLTGQRFGRLVVIERMPKGKHGEHAKWRCLCDCGNENVVVGTDLRSGHTQSCGCYCRDLNRSMKTKDMLGQRFGKLTVIAFAGVDENNKAEWKCRCDCGNEVIVTGGNLRSGNTTSCGCVHKKQLSERNSKLLTTHGMSKTRLYTIWTDMKQRCGNPNDKYYYLYGGRGISVCSEWKSNFKSFAEWALANGYQDNLSIDRIDNDKGYCSDNCRWATAKEQANNKRKKVKT